MSIPDANTDCENIILPQHCECQNHHMVTRSKAGVHKSNPEYALLASTIPVEPKSIKGALKHEGWKVAMVSELEALEVNNTWTLVPEIHPIMS